MIEVTNRYDAKKIFLHKEKIESLLHGEVPTPVCFEIDPADGFCNQSCVECSYSSSTRSVLRLLDRDLLLQTLPELASGGVRSVEWVGGSEPLLHPDIGAFIKAAKVSGLRCGIITNGVLLPRIYENILAGDLDYVRISLDAASPEVYEMTHRSKHFAQVIAQLREILTRGANPALFGISYRILEANVKDIARAAQMMSQFGIGYIQYKYSLANNNTEYFFGHDGQIAGEIAEAKQWQSSVFSVLGGDTLKDITSDGITEGLHCTSSPLVGVITAGGDIPFCIRYRNVPAMYIGNVRDGFKNVWGSERHKTLLVAEAKKHCHYVCKHHKYNRALLQYCSNGSCPNVSPQPGVTVNAEFI